MQHLTRQDLKHIALDLPLSFLAPILLYSRFGFQNYGYPHITFILLAHIFGFPLEDFFDRQRTFPIFALPLIVICALLYPLITLLFLIGLITINIRSILKRQSFLLEKIENTSVFLIFIPISFMVYSEPFKAEHYLTGLFIGCAADTFHKIFHRETVNLKLSFLTSYLFLGLALLFVPVTAQLVGFALMLVGLSVVGLARPSRMWGFFYPAFLGGLSYYYLLFVWI